MVVSSTVNYAANVCFFLKVSLFLSLHYKFIEFLNGHVLSTIFCFDFSLALLPCFFRHTRALLSVEITPFKYVLISYIMFITLPIYWSLIRITAIFCFSYAIVALLCRLQPPGEVGRTGRYEQMQTFSLFCLNYDILSNQCWDKIILHPYSVVKINKHLFQSRHINSHFWSIDSFIIQLTKFIWMLDKDMNWTVMEHFAPLCKYRCYRNTLWTLL